jgi:hypothetical protein
MYKVKNGESIGDVSLNACGSLAAWEDILNLNSFTDWTPILFPGQEIEVPAILDAPNQSLLSKYASNNDSGVDIDSLISTFIAILNSVVVSAYTPSTTTETFINYYTIKNGESILDACLNSTGTINNWEAVLTANVFVDWNPDLIPGSKIIIPAGAEIQNNVLKITSKYPSNNDPSISNLSSLVDDFIALFYDLKALTCDNIIVTCDNNVITCDSIYYL